MADNNQPRWETVNWLTNTRDPIILEECQVFTRQLTTFVGENTRLLPMGDDLDWLKGNTNPKKVSMAVVLPRDLVGRIIRVLEMEAHAWDTQAHCADLAEADAKLLKLQLEEKRQ